MAPPACGGADVCVDAGIPVRSEARKAACHSYPSSPSEAPSVCWSTAISLKSRARAGRAVYRRAAGFSDRLLLRLKQAGREVLKALLSQPLSLPLPSSLALGGVGRDGNLPVSYCLSFGCCGFA